MFKDPPHPETDEKHSRDKIQMKHKLNNLQLVSRFLEKNVDCCYDFYDFRVLLFQANKTKNLIEVKPRKKASAPNSSRSYVTAGKTYGSDTKHPPSFSSFTELVCK